MLVLQPLATHASALELWQEVTVVSKGDKHLLKVEINFANVILATALYPLLHVKEGYYGRYKKCDGLLPWAVGDSIILIQEDCLQAQVMQQNSD